MRSGGNCRPWSIKAKQLPEKYSISGFVFVYYQCQAFDGLHSKAIDSGNYLLKYLPLRKDTRPLIKFTDGEKQMIPSDRENISSAVIGMYYQ